MIRFAHQSAGNKDIGDEGAASIFDAIINHPKLQVLEIYGALLCIVHFDISSEIGLSTKGAIKLSQCIPSLTPLKKLGVGRNPIGDEGASLILESLSKHSPSIHLEGLSLYGNDL